jgi:hypothetical protein
MKSTISDDASLANRLEVVGWRNNVATVEGFEERGTSDRSDPGRWRGDDDTEDYSSEFSLFSLRSSRSSGDVALPTLHWS